MNVLIGRGNAVHATVYKMNLTHCGAEGRNGMRGHSARYPVKDAVTCKRCLKILAKEIAEAWELAENFNRELAVVAATEAQAEKMADAELDTAILLVSGYAAKQALLREKTRRERVQVVDAPSTYPIQDELAEATEVAEFGQMLASLATGDLMEILRAGGPRERLIPVQAELARRGDPNSQRHIRNQEEDARRTARAEELNKAAAERTLYRNGLAEVRTRTPHQMEIALEQAQQYAMSLERELARLRAGQDVPVHRGIHVVETSTGVIAHPGGVADCALCRRGL